MNKVKYFIVFISFIVTVFSGINIHAEPGDQTLKQAVEFIAKSKSEEGLRELDKIISSPAVGMELKIKAYFLKAMMFVDSGKRDAAQVVLRSMLNSGLGYNYDMKKLPLQAWKNAKLAELYEKTRKEFVKRDSKLSGRALEDFKDAKKAYRNRDYEKANQLLEACMSACPQNSDVEGLKLKIDEIQKKREEVLMVLPDEFCKRALAFLSRGNLLEALYEAKRALVINPEHQEAEDVYKEINSQLKRFIDESIEDDGDKAEFEKAVKYYLEDDIVVATKIFRKLQSRVPSVSLYIDLANYHAMDKTNKNRAEKYYRTAVRDMERGDYRKARENLSITLGLDKTMVDARCMLAEVEVIMGISSVEIKD
ncbi:MAG: hypothetical protein WC955_03205 [Elusimicrobiota bacterium]